VTGVLQPKGPPCGIEVEGFDEFADAQQGSCPGPVVAAELRSGERGDVGRASRGEHRLEFAFGFAGEIEIPG
jgi:hypothetical protein